GFLYVIDPVRGGGGEHDVQLPPVLQRPRDPGALRDDLERREITRMDAPGTQPTRSHKCRAGGRLLPSCKIMRGRRRQRTEWGENGIDRDMGRHDVVPRARAASAARREFYLGLEQRVLLVERRLHGGRHVRIERWRRESYRAVERGKMVAAVSRKYRAP